MPSLYTEVLIFTSFIHLIGGERNRIFHQYNRSNQKIRVIAEYQRCVFHTKNAPVEKLFSCSYCYSKGPFVDIFARHRKHKTILQTVMCQHVQQVPFWKRLMTK